MYARTILNGHSGKGIVLMVNAQDVEREAIQRVVNGGSMPVYRPGDYVSPFLTKNCKVVSHKGWQVSALSIESTLSLGR